MPPDEADDLDEEELTSVMSREQRKMLLQAASQSADALERDTARPQPGTAPEVAIPKAPAVPRDAALAAVVPLPSAARPMQSPAPDAASRSISTSAWGTWALAAFVLLVGAVAFVLFR